MGAPETSEPADDLDVVVVKEAAPGVVESGTVEQYAAVDAPPAEGVSNPLERVDMAL